ncbi:MAG: ArsR/SmtB family transcription factor [Salibacteraceae bacterium]
MANQKTDAFKAIADPRRRKIIQMLMVSSLSLGAITESFDMSRQAISRHINTLEESGLLITKKQGRETICFLDMAPMKEVFDEIQFYYSFWESKLKKLDDLMNEG